MAKSPLKAGDLGLTVGIDDGYAQTKVYGTSPDGKGVVSKVFRTAVRTGRYGLKALHGEGAIDAYRVEEGDDYTVSDLIAGEGTQFDSFHVSPMNRVLVHHGLLQAGYGGQPVDVMTGLPVADFFDADGGINKAHVAAKRANLGKGVTRISNEAPLASIASVNVGCQAVAAYIDHMVDDVTLEYRFQPGGKMAVVDIGGRTTDIAVVVGGNGIDPKASGTKNAGVLDVYNTLKDMIRREFDLRDDIPLADLDAAVRSRTIPLWGQPQDIGSLVDAAIREVEGPIALELERRLGKGAAFSAIVFVGGGANLFNGLVGRFRNGKLAHEPEFANARGLWKLARINQKKKSAA